MCALNIVSVPVRDSKKKKKPDSSKGTPGKGMTASFLKVHYKLFYGPVNKQDARNCSLHDF